MFGDFFGCEFSASSAASKKVETFDERENLRRTKSATENNPIIIVRTIKKKDVNYFIIAYKCP